jgi:hypothetical protein
LSTFLARAEQSLLSVGILSERGLIADALSAGRTVVETSIDFAYIAKDPAVRIPKFESYDHVSKFRLAKAVDKLHGGKVEQAAMATLKQLHDTARANNPDSKANWAGETLKDRATEAGRVTNALAVKPLQPRVRAHLHLSGSPSTVSNGPPSRSTLHRKSSRSTFVTLPSRSRSTTAFAAEIERALRRPSMATSSRWSPGCAPRSRTGGRSREPLAV